MITVCFRFYEELNRYLPERTRKVWFEYFAAEGTPVGQAIQAMGVPESEIDLILVNQQSKGWDYLLRDGDRVSVYPVFELFNIAGVTKLRERPLRNPSFICDVHLGRLCRYLRILGLDTLYSNSYTPDEMISISVKEKRIILSKCYRLVKNEQVTHGYWIRSSAPKEQLRDVLNKLDLRGAFNPLSRCLNCNSLIKPIAKNQVLHRLQPNTLNYFDEFFICDQCDHVFWKGSHYDSMLEFVSHLK